MGSHGPAQDTRGRSRSTGQLQGQNKAKAIYLSHEHRTLPSSQRDGMWHRGCQVWEPWNLNRGVSEQGILGFLTLSPHSECYQEIELSVTAKMTDLWKKQGSAQQTPREQMVEVI